MRKRSANMPPKDKTWLENNWKMLAALAAVVAVGAIVVILVGVLDPNINIGMLITLVAGFIVLIGANTYVVIYFQHEEDRNQANLPKAVVVVGLLLLEANILLLPFDVSNTRFNGGFPMEILWQVLFWWITVWAVMVMPFTFFFYEAEAPGTTKGQQAKEAACWAGGFFCYLYAGVGDHLLFVGLHRHSSHGDQQRHADTAVHQREPRCGAAVPPDFVGW